MKRLLLTTLTALMLMPLTATAQDDMYFVPTKSNVKKSAEKYGMPKDTYYCGSKRDVDEYNRRLKSKVEVISDDALLAGNSLADNDTLVTDTLVGDTIVFIAEKGVYPKDVILNVLGKIKADGAVYKCIDFTGSYVEGLDVPGRMTMCNMAVEMGAKTAYMQPNQAVLDYVAPRAVRPWQVVTTDPDFKYAESHAFDVSAMEPVVSCPHDVDNVHPISEIAAKNIPLNQAYIGSCTNGRTEDIAQAAAILKGKHIPKYARLLVDASLVAIHERKNPPNQLICPMLSVKGSCTAPASNR